MLTMDIKNIIDKAGGVRAVAGELGLSTQALYRWHRVPAEHVITIARLSGLQPHEVRPDVFPEGTPVPKPLPDQSSAEARNVAAVSG